MSGVLHQGRRQSLASRLDSLRSLAESTYRLLHQYLSSPILSTGRNSRTEILRLAHLVLSLAGQLHSISLSTSTYDGARQDGLDGFNLCYLETCQRQLSILRGMLVSLLKREELREERGTRNSGEAPSGNLFTTEAELEIYWTDLQDLCSRMTFAMAADSMTGIYHALSGPKRGRESPWLDLPIRIPFEKARSEILDALCSHRSNYYAERKLEEQRCPLLNSNVLEDPLYVEWLHGGLDRLWIHGPAGTGKAVLAAGITQRILHGLERDTAVCFHFDNYMDDSSRRLSNILGTLLCQLVAQSPEGYQQLREHFNIKWDLDNPIPPRLTSVKDARAEYSESRALVPLFEAAAGAFDRVYVILCGIEKAADHLVRVLAPMQVILDRCAQCKVLVLTRTFNDLLSLASQSHFSLLQIRPAADEVLCFVEETTKKKAECGELDLDLSVSRYIAKRFLETNITCLWMDLQLEYLLSLSSDTDRIEALDYLPPTIDATYERILGQVDRQVDPVAWKLRKLSLSWIIHLEEKLTVPELCEALSVALSPNASRLNQVSTVEEADIIRVCGKLIRRSDAGNYFEITHPTAHEFLTRQTVSDKEDRWITGQQEAEESLLTACLRFLTFPEFARDPRGYYTEKLYILARQKDHPFYGYAASWWPSLSSANWDAVRGIACDLFNDANSYNFKPWLLEYCQRHFPERFGFGGLPRPFTDLIDWVTKQTLSRLHVAACLGLPELCWFLVEIEGYDVDRQSLGSSTPLYMALIGPQVLAIDNLAVSSATWTRIHMCPFSIRQKETVDILLRLGAKGSPYYFNDTLLSMSSAALLASARMQDVEVFTSVHENGARMDTAFIDTLSRIDITRPYSEVAVVLLHAVPTPDRKIYVNSLCQYIIDVAVKSMLVPHREFQLGDTQEIPEQSDLFKTAWDIATEVGAPCANVDQKRKVNCDDGTFAAFARGAIRDSWCPGISRLLQDPRWVPNMSLEAANEADESAGQTALHCAVEAGDLTVIELLMRHGSNPNKRDSKGRSPLLLAETPEVLKILVSNGADLNVVDEDGRSIWHYAAANDDINILAALEKLDPDKDGSLTRAANNGRTPLAEAFAYIHELVSRIFSTEEKFRRKAKAACFLLDICRDDPAYFRSDIPLIHLAAEWGLPKLVDGLAKFTCVDFEAVADDGSNAFHFLNFSATKAFIQLLKGICGSALVGPRRDGKTPAETIFFNFKTDTDDKSVLDRSGHPSFWGSPDKGVIIELLTPGVVRSKDGGGRTLWERFCDDVLCYYGLRVNLWPILKGPLLAAVEAFFESGAFKVHEEQKKGSGCLPLFNAMWTDGVLAPWSHEMFVLAVEATEYFTAIREHDNVVHTFLWAMQLVKRDLCDLMLEKGFSVHKQYRGRSALFDACLPGPIDVSSFERIVRFADRSQLDKSAGYGRTALQVLCSEPDGPRVLIERARKVEVLLDAGADPNSVAAEGTPMVVLALMRGQASCAITLINRGADFEAPARDGIDAMLAAALRGYSGVLRAIQRVARPGYNWKRTDSIFLSRGALQGRKVRFAGCGGIHLAALNSQIETIEFFLNCTLTSVGDISSPEEMWTPLHFAAFGGSVEGIRFLASRGADINARDWNQRTPLHRAAYRNHLDCVRALLELGCDMICEDEQGSTPAITALASNAVQSASLLIRVAAGLAPADGCTRDPREAVRSSKEKRLLGKALEIALQRNDQTLCEAVLAQGCPVDIELPGCFGCTALLWSARNGNLTMTDFFLARGARKFTGRCKMHNPKGYNVVLEASVCPKTVGCLRHILDTTLTVGFNWFNADLLPTHVAAMERNPEGLRTLLGHVESHIDIYRDWLFPTDEVDLPFQGGEHGRADPAVKLLSDQRMVTRWLVNRHVHGPGDSARFFNGPTALHMSMVEKDIGSARILLAHFADVDALDDAWAMPLHVAAKGGFVPGVKLLLEHKCSVDLRDRDGYTPLMRAASQGSLEISRMLIQHGADAQVLDVDRMSILNHSADKGGNPALFRYLVEEVGLDPFKQDCLGYNPVHDALSKLEFTAFILSGNYDVCKLVEDDDDAVDTLLEIVERGNSKLILPRFLRVLSKRIPDRMLAEGPQICARALNAASCRNKIHDMEILVQAGADIDRNSDDGDGSSLMLACSFGRLEAIRFLVRAGAQISYCDEDGQFHNALETAERFPEIVNWLLVTRHMEMKALPSEAADAVEIAIAPWSGIVAVPYLFSGAKGCYGRAYAESTLDFVVRTSRLKREMRGRVVVPYNFVAPQPVSIIPQN